MKPKLENPAVSVGICGKKNLNRAFGTSPDSTCRKTMNLRISVVVAMYQRQHRNEMVRISLPSYSWFLRVPRLHTEPYLVFHNRLQRERIFDTQTTANTNLERAAAFFSMHHMILLCKLACPDHFLCGGPLPLAH